MTPDGAAQHLGHPRVALDQRRGHQVRPRISAPVAAVTRRHRGLGGVDLAQGGQHVTDVGQEAVVGTDHQHPGPGELLAVGVQEIGGPVQVDRVLPVPGAPGCRASRTDAARTMRSCSGWMVATMSRIGPVRGRSISDSRIADSARAADWVSSSSSYAVNCPCEKPTGGGRTPSDRPVGLVEGQDIGPASRSPRLTAGLAGDVAAADVASRPLRHPARRRNRAGRRRAGRSDRPPAPSSAVEGCLRCSVETWSPPGGQPGGVLTHPAAGRRGTRRGGIRSWMRVRVRLRRSSWSIRSVRGSDSAAGITSPPIARRVGEGEESR